MSNFKSLSQILSENDNRQEVYSSDQKYRDRLKKRGYFTRDEECFDFIQLINAWDKIVGKMLASNTIPRRIQRSTLIVVTKHNIFAQELGFMAPQIIQKIEKQLPQLKGKITKIKFNYANYSWEEYAGQLQETNSANPARPKLHPRSPYYLAKKNKAQTSFSDIEDPDLKDILIKLFIEYC